MKLCLQFCWKIENQENSTNTAELDHITEEFNKKSNSLYTILRSSRLAGSQRAPFLRRFLLRLNFNSFFEVNLHACPLLSCFIFPNCTHTYPLCLWQGLNPSTSYKGYLSIMSIVTLSQIRLMFLNSVNRQLLKVWWIMLDHDRRSRFCRNALHSLSTQVSVRFPQLPVPMPKWCIILSLFKKRVDIRTRVYCNFLVELFAKYILV